MREGAKAAAFGALLAVVVGVAVLAGLIAMRERTPDAAEKALLVVTAQSDTQGEIVAAVIEVDVATGSSRALEVFAPTTVSGTSASNAFEAYAYGGGDLVSQAVEEQTGGENLPWIVVTAPVWRRIVTDAGGARVTLDHSVNVYAESTLTVIPEGGSVLDGTGLAALARSIEYLSDSERKPVGAALGEAMREAFSESGTDFAGLVGTEGIKASSSAEGLESLVLR